jgi:enoyl-CoA hydratase/3-hydroxyacyl-CoA dehydrogenase
MKLEDIKTITVLGAGTMGHGIAEIAALAGYRVRMRDISEEFVKKGYDQIAWSLKKLVRRAPSPRESRCRPETDNSLG